MLSAEHVQQTVASLMARYTSRPAATQQAIVAVWLDDLDGLSDEELTAAVRSHVRDPNEGRFWPTTAHLIGQLERLRAAQTAQIEGPRVSPEEEWRLVDFAIRSFGGSDFGVQRAQAHLGPELWEGLGGASEYHRLRMVNIDELMSERARFCAARKAQQARAVEARRMAPVLEVLTGGGQLSDRRPAGFVALAEALPDGRAKLSGRPDAETFETVKRGKWA